MDKVRKSDHVLLTTIFPSSEGYFDDFFTSLQNQTIKDFDVLVINDGIKKFQSYKSKYSSLHIIEVKVLDSPAKNRETGINKALELGYKNIVFGDSDDYFSDNRLEKSIDSLQEFDLVFNELIIFSQNFRIDNFLISKIKTLDKIQDTIFDGNVFGMSNIAIRSAMISNRINFNKRLIAVDWFFITSLFIQNKLKIKFLRDIYTFYRQYDNNTIGMSMLLTNQKLNLGIKVKELHYTALISYCKNDTSEKYRVLFETKFKEVLNLKQKLKKEEFKKNYIEVVNTHFQLLFTGWWSEIINLETYYKYENKDK